MKVSRYRSTGGAADLDAQASDMSERAFFFHAKHGGGGVYRPKDESHLDGAMRMVRQAFELARGSANPLILLTNAVSARNLPPRCSPLVTVRYFLDPSRA